jgi:hypothetical protein
VYAPRVLVSPNVSPARYRKPDTDGVRPGSPPVSSHHSSSIRRCRARRGCVRPSTTNERRTVCRSPRSRTRLRKRRGRSDNATRPLRKGHVERPRQGEGPVVQLQAWSDRPWTLPCSMVRLPGRSRNRERTPRSTTRHVLNSQPASLYPSGLPAGEQIGSYGALSSGGSAAAAEPCDGSIGLRGSRTPAPPSPRFHRLSIRRYVSRSC